MKITERHLRRIVRGSLSEVAPPTVGAVLDAIEAVQGVEGKAAKKEKMKAIAKKVGWEAVKFIPIVGKPVAGIKKLSDLYKTAKGTPGSAVVKDDVVLDMIQIDPEYQRMLDDDLEDKFDEFAIDKLNSLPRDAPLPDMTAALEKWVKKNFDDRGIEGAVTENRMRVTKRQLRRIIKEAARSQGVTDWVVTIEFNDGKSEEHVVRETDEKSAELAGLERLDGGGSKKSAFQVRKVTAVDTGTRWRRGWRP